MNLRSENRWDNGIGIFLVIVGVLMRVLPHPANFAPVAAIAFFGGVVLAPEISLFLPLAIMIVSDLIIGPHALYPVTWGSFFLVGLLGTSVRGHARPVRVLFGTFAGSLLFFILTNLGVFLFQSMYEKSWAGLAQCYWMALPFFRNSLLGDLFYSALLFGIFAAAKNYTARFISQKIS